MEDELKFVHYPRVSTKKQVEEGDSIETQERRLDEHSTRNKHKCVGIYSDEGKSASLTKETMKISYADGFFHISIDIRKRLGTMKIAEETKKDLWDGVKITRWDRFSRNNVFSEIVRLYLQEHDKMIVAIDDSNDPLVRDVIGAVSQEEIRKLKRRVRETRQYRFENGMIVSKSPYGYKPVIREKKVIGFVHSLKEAEIVKQCFEKTNAGEDYKSICKQVGLRPQQYYNIIKNKVYCGYVTFEGQEKKGNHPPMITEELWKQVNNKQ